MSIPPTERDPTVGVPPTERDPTLVSESEPAPLVKKRKRWPWVLLIALVALAVAGAYLYYAVLRPEPTARRHVPAGTSVALRADALEILLWKPVRKHLWPIAFETGEGEEPAQSRRAKLIQQETGVRIPTDFREVIIASMDGVSWVAIVGGTIERGRFVSGLEEALREEDVKGWHRDGELLVHELGPSIGQADDGTLLVGTDTNIVRAALPVDEDQDVDALPLPSDGAASFVVLARAYRGAISQLPLSLPGLDALDKVERVRGTVALSDEPRISVEATPKDGVDAATLASDIQSALMKLRIASLLITADLYGAKQALSDATIRADGKLVKLDAPWPYADLDRAILEVANTIRKGR